MAWPTMHFATGMACGGAAAMIGCLILRRGWRWVPPLMTLGGIWACVPDMPRFFRVDFPSLTLSGSLGSMDLERWLHHWGNVFFFHRALDEQPRELALHGLIGILFLYNAAIAGLLLLEQRQRNSPGNRWWKAHGRGLPKPMPHGDPLRRPTPPADDSPERVITGLLDPDRRKPA